MREWWDCFSACFSRHPAISVAFLFIVISLPMLGYLWLAEFERRALERKRIAKGKSDSERNQP